MTHHRCAVIGSPVTHSLSPVMHRAAYERLHLAWSYSAIEVGVADLPAFLDGLDASWRGLSLTMPLKRAVLPLLDDVSATAAEVGAANTVVLDHGRRLGDNTDVPGMVAALGERDAGGPRSATVLGTGATAASAVCALGRLGVRDVTILGRDRGSAAELAEWAARSGMSATVAAFSDRAPPVDLLVSTLPGSAVLADAAVLVDRAAIVFDVSYAPWPSRLLRLAVAAGRRTVSGLDLLAHQAGLQVQAMTGRAVPVDVLREAARTALGSAP